MSSSNIPNFTRLGETGMYHPAVTRSNIASTWGIGGFATPQPPMPPPCPSQTVASTLGNPQMPSVYLNSRAPMGYNFRMAGASFPFVYKRKQDEDSYDSQPTAKQHITEEKVSAHLNSLHLSDRYQNHKLGKSAAKHVSFAPEPRLSEDEEDQPTSSTSGSNSLFAPDGCNPARNRRLVISDEVRRITPGESKLPESLLNKLIQPKMDLVLWKPPTDVIRDIISSTTNNKEETAPTTETLPQPNDRSQNQVEPEPSTSSTNLPAHNAPRSESPQPSTSYGGGSPDSGISLDLNTGGSSYSGLEASSTGRARSPPDFERMEFNNNVGNAVDLMWHEENNNSALVDLNTLHNLHSLLPLPDDDDMDL